MPIQVCSDDHAEVCYEYKFSYDKCPVCALIEKHNEILKEKDEAISHLENDVEKLENEKDELRSQLNMPE